jgi:hypothetical protein
VDAPSARGGDTNCNITSNLQGTASLNQPVVAKRSLNGQGGMECRFPRDRYSILYGNLVCGVDSCDQSLNGTLTIVWTAAISPWCGRLHQSHHTHLVDTPSLRGRLPHPASIITPVQSCLVGNPISHDQMHVLFHVRRRGTRIVFK